MENDTYSTLKEELFALRFLEQITKNEAKQKIIKEKIKETKKKMLKERMIQNDKHKRR